MGTIITFSFSSLSELRNELEKRNKIRDWERKRDELNEKLSRCEDKLRIQIQDQLREELAPSEEILAAAKVDINIYFFNEIRPCISHS